MFKVFKQIFVFLIMVQLLSGCTLYLAKQVLKPKPYGMGDTPDGTPEFQAGWDDGCESGLSAYGGSRYKAAYSFKQNVDLLDDPEYYRAWKDAYTYCRWYVWNWDRPWNM